MPKQFALAKELVCLTPLLEHLRTAKGTSRSPHAPRSRALPIQFAKSGSPAYYLDEHKQDEHKHLRAASQQMYVSENQVPRIS